MQATRMAKVGTILVVVSVGFAILWWYSAGYLFLDWYWSYQISALTFAVLMASPSAALSIAGLVLYVAGRKIFWNSQHIPKVLLIFVGLALMLVGGFFTAWHWAFATYAAGKLGPPYDKPLNYYLGTSSPYFILFALWILSGLVMFADAADALLSGRRIPVRA